MTSPPSPSSKPKTSGLAIAALILAILFFPVGFVLGIIALIQIRKSDGALGGQGLALAAIIIPGIMIPVVGILAAIAIPNFVRYQNRAKQAEVRITLRQLATAQAAFHAEHDGYVGSALNPSVPPGAQRAPWEARACPADCGKENLAACTELSCADFTAPGPMYFRYACETSRDPAAFTCIAIGDLDGDGELSVFVYGSAPEGAATIQAPLSPLAESHCQGAVPANAIHECTPGET